MMTAWTKVKQVASPALNRWWLPEQRSNRWQALPWTNDDRLDKGETGGKLFHEHMMTSWTNDKQKASPAMNRWWPLEHKPNRWQTLPWTDDDCLNKGQTGGKPCHEPMMTAWTKVKQVASLDINRWWLPEQRSQALTLTDDDCLNKGQTGGKPCHEPMMTAWTKVKQVASLDINRWWLPEQRSNRWQALTLTDDDCLNKGQTGGKPWH